MSVYDELMNEGSRFPRGGPERARRRYKVPKQTPEQRDANKKAIQDAIAKAKAEREAKAAKAGGAEPAKVAEKRDPFGFRASWRGESPGDLKRQKELSRGPKDRMSKPNPKLSGDPPRKEAKNEETALSKRSLREKLGYLFETLGKARKAQGAERRRYLKGQYQARSAVKAGASGREGHKRHDTRLDTTKKAIGTGPEKVVARAVARGRSDRPELKAGKAGFRGARTGVNAGTEHEGPSLSERWKALKKAAKVASAVVAGVVGSGGDHEPDTGEQAVGSSAKGYGRTASDAESADYKRSQSRRQPVNRPRGGRRGAGSVHPARARRDWTEYEGPSLSEQAEYIKQLLETIATTQKGSVTKTNPPIRSSHKKTLVVSAPSRTSVKTVGQRGRLGAQRGVIPQK